MTAKQKQPLIPSYAVFPLLACVAVNFIVYGGLASIADSWKHYDFTLPIDRAFPLIPEFVVIYIGCYIFWIANYIIIARQGKEHCMRFVTADILSRFICCAFYLLIPTTNVRPVIAGDGIFEQLLAAVYALDAPTRLFPSIHCLVSWFCYIGIRGNKNVPKPYRIFSCIFAVLVFISTQVTKQHYIVDVLGALIIAELTYYFALHTKAYRRVERLFDKIYGFVYLRKERRKDSV